MEFDTLYVEKEEEEIVSPWGGGFALLCRERQGSAAERIVL